MEEMGQVAVSAFTFLSGKVKAFSFSPFCFAREHKKIRSRVRSRRNAVKSDSRLVRVVISWAFWTAGMNADAYWLSILADDFSNSSSAWSYTGVSNAASQPLFSVESGAQNVHAEWSQTNGLVLSGDPYTITASRLSRPLSRVLTDDDTFRFGFTLNIASGSIPDTLEFSSIVNVGLYNLSKTGSDRNLTDDYSGNSNLVKDACDFVEFNYFVNNKSWGVNPSIQPTIGAHVDGLDYDWILGSWSDPMWHSTDMEADHWLPTGTNMYVEVVYYGDATNSWVRRAMTAIYSDVTRSNLLSVNGVEMYYWTVPVASEKSFTLTDFAICNFVDGVFYGGPAWHGAGTFDDVYVDQYVRNGDFFSQEASGSDQVLQWAAASGTTYYVEYSSNLLANTWVTNAILQASGETVTYTNPLSGKGGCVRVSF